MTDLIVEEAGEYLAAMGRVGMAPIFLAAPTSPDERLEAIAANSKGFIYAISRVGITGTQQSLTGDAAALVARIRQWPDADGTTLPVAVGFGISNAEHVAQVGRIRGCGGGGQRDSGAGGAGDQRRRSGDGAGGSGSIYQGPEPFRGAGPVRTSSLASSL